MSTPVPAPYRPRSMAHPGPVAPVRLAHVATRGQRQWSLVLAPGQVLLTALTTALAAQGVKAAALALLGGELQSVAYCLPIPDPEGQVIATYGTPLVLQNACLLRGSATLGQAADGAPVVHCHATFADAQGTVRGGHVLTDRTMVGNRPVSVLVTALDGMDLRLGFDPETRLHMLKPSPQQGQTHD